MSVPIKRPTRLFLAMGIKIRMDKIASNPIDVYKRQTYHRRKNAGYCSGTGGSAGIH